MLIDNKTLNVELAYASEQGILKNPVTSNSQWYGIWFFIYLKDENLNVIYDYMDEDLTKYGEDLWSNYFRNFKSLNDSARITK